MSTVVTGLIGALIGAAIKMLVDYLTYVRTRQRSIRLAALKCLDRLEKLKPIHTELTQEHGADFNYMTLLDNDDRKPRINNELWHLGTDLDAFLNAIIDAKRTTRSAHLDLYAQMRPLVSDHKLAALEGTIIPELRQLAQIDTPPSRSALTA